MSLIEHSPCYANQVILLCRSFRSAGYSKPVPNLPPTVFKAFCIIAVFRCQIRDSLSSSGHEQHGLHRRHRGLVPKQVVNAHDGGAGLRLMLLDIRLPVLLCQKHMGSRPIVCHFSGHPLLSAVQIIVDFVQLPFLDFSDASALLCIFTVW